MRNARLLPRTTPPAEVANFYTHAVGVFLCLVGLPLLVSRVEAASLPTFGFWVFGISAIILYFASTIYHGVQRPKQKYLLQKLDHIAIYFLIAGTNTPFVQLYLDAPWNLYYLLAMWGLVFMGTIYKIFFFGRWPIFSTIFYLALGWMAVLVIPAMMNSMPMTSFWWIVIGGVSYSVGVIFYSWERLYYHHAIWHVFVLGGTAGHYMALWSTAG
jgi:hemolysin III